MKKKILSILLAVVMVIGMFPMTSFTVFAAGNTLYYRIDGEGSSKKLHISNSNKEGYLGFDDAKPPLWFESEEFKTVEEVYIDDVIIPTRIAYWFCNMTSEGVIEESNIHRFYGLDNIDMSNVVNADYAFAGVRNAKLSFNELNLTKVSSAEGMFKDSSIDAASISKIHTTPQLLMNTSYMFSGCLNLTGVVCPEIGDGVNAEGMFADTTNMDTLKFFDNSSYSQKANFKGFLKGSGVSRVDITQWVPTEGSDISEMFADCKMLVRISAAHDTDWSTVNGCNCTDLFKGCDMLVGSEGTRYFDCDNGVYFAKTDKVKTSGVSAGGYFFDITANTGLTITRDGVPAVSGTDYELNGDKITIKTPGLTVSGATTSQYIQVNATATDLTIEDLYIAIVDNYALYFNDKCTLNLKGTNVISTARTYKYALYFYADGEITGSGNLVVSSPNNAIDLSGGVTISATGLLLIRGTNVGLDIYKSLRITDTVGRLLFYGKNEYDGAVAWHYCTANGNNVNVSRNLILKGSTAVNVPESEITADALCYTRYFGFKVGDEIARSVLVSHQSHNFSKGVYRNNGETHSRVCTCGYIDTPVAHDYSAYLYDNGDGTHCGRCICGAIDVSNKVKHKFVDGKCACGAVKAPVSEYFIVGGKAIGGGTQSADGIKFDGLYDSTIYVEEGTAAKIQLYAAASSCWRHTEKTGDNWGVVYGNMPSESINADFDNSKESQWATITVSADADANDTLTLQSSLYNDGQYKKTVTTTIKVVSRKDLAKESISSTTYPLYLTVGSGLVSLDNANGTHYIASDYEIGTKAQEHSDKSSDCLDAMLADSDDFTFSEDGTVFGILDSTGEKTGAYVSGIDMARVLDEIVKYNGDSSHSASYIYATDGKLITKSNKGNYEVVPVAIKMLNTADDGKFGWYINTAIKRKAIIKYDLNSLSGASFTYRMMGSSSKTIYTTTVPGEVNAEMILTTGLGMPTHTRSGEARSIDVNDTVPVRYNNKDYDIQFLGWNTAKNGTGTMYAPADKPELNRDTTLYAIWGASYSVYYYKDSYDKFNSLTGRIGTATLVGIIDNTITIPEGNDKGELNYKKSAVGEDYEYYNNGVMVTSEVIKPNGTSLARVVYSKIEHIHTAGEEMMHNDTAHWHVCGSTAGKCELKTQEDYENAFAADTDGTLKEALRYEEHDNTLILVDNGDGTHSPKCSCGVKATDKSVHVYSNGSCICGAEEPVPSVKFGSFSYCGSRSYKSSVGVGRGFYWGIRIRGFEILNKGFEQLESISMREFETGGTYTLYLFSMGLGQSPNMYSITGQPDYQQTFTVGGTSGWKTVELNQPYTLTTDKDLWIVLYCDDIFYPATMCEYVNNQEGSWVSTDGSNWMNLCNAGIEGSWMIKANFNTEHVHNYVDGVCEGCGDIEPIPSEYDGCFSYVGSRNYAMSWNPAYPAYWGIRIPDGTVPHSHLSKVMFYQGNESGTYRLLLYSTPYGAVPSDVYQPDYEQEFTVTGEPGWITIELDTPYALRKYKDIWIVFYSDGIENPIICADYTSTPDSLWISDGKDWHYSIAEGYYYSGMVKGCFENLEHTHVASTTYMCSNTAHWHTCDAKNCPLGSVASYEAAFAADTDGSLKNALGYEEHNFNAYLVDNGDGTHSYSCICGSKDKNAEKIQHVFKDGVCEGCGCTEPVPSYNNGWFSYIGSREFSGSIILTNDMYWGIRVPAEKIRDYSHISKIQLYKGYVSGNYKLLLFSTLYGTKPADLSQADYEQTFVVDGSSGWKTLELETPFALKEQNDLWIIFYSDNIPCAAYTNNGDGLLMYDGATLVNSINLGYYYSGMVKGFFVTLDTAKADAIAEINSAKTDDNAAIANKAIEDINAVTTIEEILPIKVNALAAMRAADILAAAKREAIAEINAVKTAASEEIANKAIEAINAVTTPEEILPIKEKALADMKAADVLAKEREDAIAEIYDARSHFNMEIADEAVKNIYAAPDANTIESIKIAALAAMKAADELGTAKEEAMSEINHSMISSDSDDIVERYYELISAATTVEKVEELKNEALAEIQKANTLYIAKINARAEILAATTVTTKEISERAIDAIFAATAIENITAIKNTALAEMEDAMDELATAKLEAIQAIISLQTEYNIVIYESAFLVILSSTTVAQVQSTEILAILMMRFVDVSLSAIKEINFAVKTDKSAKIASAACDDIMEMNEDVLKNIMLSLGSGTAEEILKTYEDGVNSIKEKALIDMKTADYYSGMSLTLNSDIYINFYMDLTEEEKENGTMTFNIGGRIVTGVKAKYNETEKKYYFACPITALEMAETVTATFSYNDVDYIQTYSVERYIEEIVGNPETYGDEAVMLAKKIANYGHYAQIYLASLHKNVVIGDGGYATIDGIFGNSNEYNINVGDATTALDGYSVTVAGATDALNLYGTTVYFDSATALNYYVKVTDGTEPTATAVNSVNKKNKNVEIKHYKDDIYIVSVKDITATELDDNIVVTVNDKLTITGSVFAYCKAVMNKEGQTDAAKNAMAAFYEYHVAAVAYAETQD